MLEQILDITKDSGLILLDCCAFVNDDGLGRDIGTRFSDSAHVTSKIKSCQEWESALYRELISQREIMIIPEIKEEVNALLVHLKHVYSHFKLLSKGTFMTESYSTRSKGKQRKTRRINEIKSRAREEMREYRKEREERRGGVHPYGWLNPLNALILDLEGALEAIPLYEQREGIERKDGRIPLNDYYLFGSAIHYLRNHPETKVTILTKDHHLTHILRDYVTEETIPKEGRIRILNISHEGERINILQNVTYDFSQRFS